VDRVAEFLGDRLRGRPVPADLRHLVELQFAGDLSGDDCPMPLCEVSVLAPGQVHSLEQDQQPLASDPNPHLTLAAGRAIDAVLAHVAVVVDGFNGDLFGYWLHPDEPPHPDPFIVKLDTEGQFALLDGTTLVEAMIFDWAYRDDDAADALAFCDERGIAVAARCHAQLRPGKPVVDPQVLSDTLYARESRYRDPLAVSTVDAVPIGIDCADPRVIRALAPHGFPADLGPLIQAADVGTGEVSLPAPACAGGIELRQRDAATWYLHLMAFGGPADDRPQCTELPFGFVLAETREQARLRFGEPDWKSGGGKLESWRFGPLDLHVSYRADNTPLFVRVFPASLVASFRYLG
jgi:hypothetical protein